MAMDATVKHKTEKSFAYENVDIAGEDSVYQNILFSGGQANVETSSRRNASGVEADEVYAQVKFLRQTVKGKRERCCRRWQMKAPTCKNPYSFNIH